MRKQRTREHIIEDLGFNHVERQVLIAGHVFSRSDDENYEYQAVIDTFNSSEEPENLHILVQMKSIDSAMIVNTSDKWLFELPKRDLISWLSDIRPVIVILFDVHSETAYYVDLETYFQENRQILKKISKFVKIYLSKNAIFDSKAIQKLQNNLK